MRRKVNKGTRFSPRVKPRVIGGKEAKSGKAIAWILYNEFPLNPLRISLTQRGLEFQFGFLYNFSRVSNIESNNSKNVGLEDYNNISFGIFPYFTTPSIKTTLGQKKLENSLKF